MSEKSGVLHFFKRLWCLSEDPWILLLLLPCGVLGEVGGDSRASPRRAAGQGRAVLTASQMAAGTLSR